MSVRSTLPLSSVGGPLPDPPPQAGEGNLDAKGEGTLLAGKSEFDADLAARRSRAARRRRLVVYSLRLLFAVVWIGSWELSTRLNWVDPFFVGQPSGVMARLWTWITEGTALGPLWLQAAVTMEEAVVGFVIGSLLGVIFGILLASPQPPHQFWAGHRRCRRRRTVRGHGGTRPAHLQRRAHLRRQRGLRGHVLAGGPRPHRGGPHQRARKAAHQMATESRQRRNSDLGRRIDQCTDLNVGRWLRWEGRWPWLSRWPRVVGARATPGQAARLPR